MTNTVRQVRAEDKMAHSVSILQRVITSFKVFVATKRTRGYFSKHLERFNWTSVNTSGSWAPTDRGRFCRCAFTKPIKRQNTVDQVHTAGIVVSAQTVIKPHIKQSKQKQPCHAADRMTSGDCREYRSLHNRQENSASREQWIVLVKPDFGECFTLLGVLLKFGECF
jgi:hypothetical protein